MARRRRAFSPAFKRAAALLVVDQGYSVTEACQAVDVGPSVLRRWVDQLHRERRGETPTTSRALTPDQQRIQELEARLRKVEREKESLKKATALLMSDSLDRSH